MQAVSRHNNSDDIDNTMAIEASQFITFHIWHRNVLCRVRNRETMQDKKKFRAAKGNRWLPRSAPPPPYLGPKKSTTNV